MNEIEKNITKDLSFTTFVLSTAQGIPNLNNKNEITKNNAILKIIKPTLPPDNKPPT